MGFLLQDAACSIYLDLVENYHILLHPILYRKIDSGSYSAIFNTTNASYVTGEKQSEMSWYVVNSYLDSPATTGTLTYKLTWYHQSPNNCSNMVIGRNSAPSRITLMELSA